MAGPPLLKSFIPGCSKGLTFHLQLLPLSWTRWSLSTWVYGYLLQIIYILSCAFVRGKTPSLLRRSEGSLV